MRKQTTVLIMILALFIAILIAHSGPSVGEDGNETEDGDGNETEEEEEDENNRSNAPPEVHIVDPNNNSRVSGRIVIRGIIVDENVCIANLQYAIGNSTEWHPLTCNSGSFNLVLNTTKYPDGPLPITFQAFDGQTNTTMANFTVIIRNSETDESTNAFHWLASPLLAAYTVLALLFVSLRLVIGRRRNTSPDSISPPHPPLSKMDDTQNFK